MRKWPLAHDERNIFTVISTVMKVLSALHFENRIRPYWLIRELNMKFRFPRKYLYTTQIFHKIITKVIQAGIVGYRCAFYWRLQFRYITENATATHVS